MQGRASEAAICREVSGWSCSGIFPLQACDLINTPAAKNKDRINRRWNERICLYVYKTEFHVRKQYMVNMYYYHRRVDNKRVNSKLRLQSLTDCLVHLEEHHLHAPTSPSSRPLSSIPPTLRPFVFLLHLSSPLPPIPLSYCHLLLKLFWLWLLASARCPDARWHLDPNWLESREPWSSREPWICIRSSTLI